MGSVAQEAATWLCRQCASLFASDDVMGLVGMRGVATMRSNRIEEIGVAQQ